MEYLDEVFPFAPFAYSQDAWEKVNSIDFNFFFRSHTKQNNVTTSAVSKRGNLQFHCFEVIVNSLNWRQVDVYVFILLPTLQTFVIFETCSDLFFKKKKKKVTSKLLRLE